MKINKIYYFVLFITIGSVLFSCKKEETEEPIIPQLQRGDLILATKISELTTSAINIGLLTSGTNTTLVPEYDIEMIKLTYSTIDGDGEPTTASGALFLPKTTGSFPLLSYHHGTLIKRSNAPSAMGSSSIEGMVGALGASLGFISCLPDYLGLGVSELVHPYLQSELGASASIDMLLAAKNYCNENAISFTNDLYICGYSEGGYVTMSTHKKLEASYSSQFNLKASAPMAGPYDVEATADGLISIGTYSSPALIGFLLYSYSEYYDVVNLSDVFKEPYLTQIPTLFDGTKDLATINASLTTDMTALLNQTFVNDFNTNSSHSLRLAFRNNSLLNWNPKSPIRLYHSMEDEIVPYAISQNAFEVLSANSTSTVELIPSPTGTHVGAAVPIVLDALEWFESLK
ncbi:MAG: hypothetical protein PF484_09885 [Bacteroidales bacterium]|jgi:predicted esterase|nr:hypothetical protein [Bacteroidales bacterium]